MDDASRYMEERGIPAYPYAPEKVVAALGAKYRFWRGSRAGQAWRS
jgi:acyl-CoA synthetase (NDP forming)